MGCGASSSSDFKATGVVPRQHKGTTPRQSSRRSTDPSPLPEAFRQCSPAPVGERRELKPSEIEHMLGEIRCCVDDQHDLDAWREGEDELRRKSVLMETLQDAQETGDLELLRSAIADAVQHKVTGLTMKLARRRLAELELESDMRKALQANPKDIQKLECALDKASVMRFTSTVVTQGAAWLSELKEANHRQKQVLDLVSELLTRDLDSPKQLTLAERAVHAAQYAKLQGPQMRALVERRKILRERASQAELSLEEVIATPAPRDKQLVSEALAHAQDCEVASSSILAFKAEISKEALADAILERDTTRLQAALEVAAGLGLDGDSLFIQASNLVEEITNAPRLLMEGRRLRAEAEQARVALEQKKREDAKAAKEVRRRAKMEAKIARVEQRRAAQEEARREAEEAKKAAAELTKRTRPAPKYPTGDWLEPAGSKPLTPAAAEGEMIAQVTLKDGIQLELEKRMQQRARPVPKFPTGDWLEKK